MSELSDSMMTDLIGELGAEHRKECKTLANKSEEMAEHTARLARENQKLTHLLADKSIELEAVLESLHDAQKTAEKVEDAMRDLARYKQAAELATQSLLAHIAQEKQ
jgi:regulator of replication initiation timing